MSVWLTLPLKNAAVRARFCQFIPKAAVVPTVRCSSMRSATLSMHFYAKSRGQNHLDLFIDNGKDMLDHFFLSIEGARKNEVFIEGRPHRRKYLNYSGEISNNRGRVRVLQRFNVASNLDLSNMNLDDIKRLSNH